MTQIAIIHITAPSVRRLSAVQALGTPAGVETTLRVAMQIGAAARSTVDITLNALPEALPHPLDTQPLPTLERSLDALAADALQAIAAALRKRAAAG